MFYYIELMLHLKDFLEMKIDIKIM